MAADADAGDMNSRLRCRMLGRRMHLHDGPIDLIIEAWGTPQNVFKAYEAAQLCMHDLLDHLCAELPVLRGSIPGQAISAAGRRMQLAVSPYAEETFMTPMAAVAGAVAEEVLRAMTEVAELDRAYVNNGGDIALHLSAGQNLVLGAVDRPDQPSLFGSAIIDSSHSVRGIATSGWRGRSFSLGIADAVTVLAKCAAVADAAATRIANDVDVPESEIADVPTIRRAPANSVDPMSDLGDRLVTRAVPLLPAAVSKRALLRGAGTARRLVDCQRIVAVALHLQGQTLVVD